MPAAELVAGSVGALTLLSRHIRETKALIEGAVEEVCGSFGGTARLSQASFERTAAFLGRADGGEDVDIAGLIGGSERVLHHLLERLTEAGEKSRSAIGRLNGIETRIGRVAHVLTQIDDITAANRVLAVNARIQVAQLGQSGSGLGVVADEISAQARRSTEFSEAISGLIAELRDAVTLSREDLVEMASHDREAIEESRREVTRAHGDFRRFLDRAQVLLSESAAESRQLTAEIHDSVRGLQFQDRASQRLEYIAGEIDRLSRELVAEMGLDEETVRRHTELAEMMARTSMAEQRDPAANAAARVEGDVELF